MSSNKGELSSIQELTYLITWFAEFSDMQKSDFLKELLKKYSPVSDDILLNGVSALGLDSGRPPSIFQCRMKLFNEWFVNWSDEEKQDLIVRLRNIDSQFMDRFESILSGSGDHEITDEEKLPFSTIDSGFDSNDYSKANGEIGQTKCAEEKKFEQIDDGVVVDEVTEITQSED